MFEYQETPAHREMISWEPRRTGLVSNYCMKKHELY